MFELLTKLSFTRGFNLLLIVFGCLAGPFCFIYRFYYALYAHNSLSKILLLSAAIGVPVCLAMSFFNALMIGIPKKVEKNFKMEWELKILGFTAGFCGFTFYGACFIGWLLVDLSARNGIEIMLYSYAGAIIYSVFYVLKKKMKQRIK